MTVLRAPNTVMRMRLLLLAPRPRVDERRREHVGAALPAAARNGTHVQGLGVGAVFLIVRVVEGPDTDETTKLTMVVAQVSRSRIGEGAGARLDERLAFLVLHHGPEAHVGGGATAELRATLVLMEKQRLRNWS
ncbi:hypothetical protein NLG97_g10572 [Lecanicillium saksenae]|uniref:Uncharacterized protein n=1 Tax=Lecanicillium saksenae TaxID=468837 RepID=A0ACC1QFA0_9HYPO|nr:hypothetical protein NLG97_g10572 [Lecanicillium saksenae]